MKKRLPIVLFFSLSCGAWSGPALAQTQTTLPPEVAAEIAPQPEAGARLITDLSDEGQAVLRERRSAESRRVMPPVPAETKKLLFDRMTSMPGMSMRDFFNFMTSKRKVAEDLTFDDVIEAMDLKANEVNFKKVGTNPIWKDVGAITGVPTERIEVLQYCDAIVGRRMMDFSPEFSVFVPCRIVVYEDANGELWLMTLDWDVSWLAMAWHPDSKLSKQLQEDAVRLRDALAQIMEAGATGDW